MCYAPDPNNLDRFAAILKEWDAYPRGIETGLPFIMDRRALETTPVMMLDTSEGALDVFDSVKGVGAFESVKAAAVRVHAGEFTFRALSLKALLAAKKAAGRPKDIDQIPEFEALIELKKG